MPDSTNNSIPSPDLDTETGAPASGPNTASPEPQDAAQPLRPEARFPVTPDNPGKLVGDDATAAFDLGPSNPTERASSEAQIAATRIDRSTASVDESDLAPLNMEDADPELDRDPA